jgi:hypothetical protein
VVPPDDPVAYSCSTTSRRVTSAPDTPAAPPTDSVARDRVSAPTTGPVFSPSAGPPTTRPTPPVRALSPVSAEEVPAPASDLWDADEDDDFMDGPEEPDTGQTEARRTWDKVLGRLSSWIVS